MTEKKQIRITIDVATHPSHGLVKGAVFEIVDTLTKQGRGANGWIVRSRATGENVHVYRHEAELVENIKGQ